MTSLQSAYAQLPANKLYVNITNANSTITDSNLSTLAFNTSVNALLSNAGTCILRDMGKTIYLPSPTVVPVGAVPGISTVLRKVQIVATGLVNGVGGSTTEAGVPDCLTGYIQIGALTYGGGNGAPVKFVRLN
jgi:hypothetical protein